MNPILTAREIQEELPQLPEVIIRTIRNVLIKCGRFARRPVKKQLLTKVQIKKRKAWAAEMLQFDNWKRVIFTDETYIEISQRSSHFVRRSNGESITAAHMIQLIKHPLKVMFWGCFSWEGPGRLYVCEGSMNSAAYINIINTQIILQAADWFSDGIPWLLQQDNAPCHMSKVSTKTFQEANIKVMNWPSSSPDMNPIENIWSVLKMKVGKMRPSTKEQLISYTLET